MGAKAVKMGGFVDGEELVVFGVVAVFVVVVVVVFVFGIGLV